MGEVNLRRVSKITTSNQQFELRQVVEWELSALPGWISVHSLFMETAAERHHHFAAGNNN